MAASTKRGENDESRSPKGIASGDAFKPPGIAIESPVDVAMVGDLTDRLANALSFPAAERASLSAAASEVAKMILKTPQHGEMAVAAMREGGVKGIAIAARFAGQSEKARKYASRRRTVAAGKTPHRRIDDLAGSFDSLEKSESASDVVVTLLKWNRPHPGPSVKN